MTICRFCNFKWRKNSSNLKKNKHQISHFHLLITKTDKKLVIHQILYHTFLSSFHTCIHSYSHYNCCINILIWLISSWGYLPKIKTTFASTLPYFCPLPLQQLHLISASVLGGHSKIFQCSHSVSLSCVFQLLDTKSTDRAQTLLHFIANMVQEKYPELASFHTELRFVDKAALGKTCHSYCTYYKHGDT